MVLRTSPVLGRALQVGVHLGAFLPLAWLALGIYANRLGGDPVDFIIHFLGKGAIHLLFLTLCVSPLNRYVKGAGLMRLRRPLGLWCFAYASLHFTAWMSLDLQFAWALVGEEIVKRNYLLLGFAAWLILLALAITSLPRILRAMGSRWKKLHNWIYAVALMAPIHYLWSVKSGWTEPLIYLGIALILVLLRRKTLLRPWRKRLQAKRASA